MITTLAGANSFLVQSALRAQVAAFLAGHDEMGLERVDGEEADFARIQEALQSLPFLASKKLVILRNPSANKQFVEQAENLFKELPETTDLIIIESKLDKRLAYYKLLKKVTDFQDCSELDEAGLIKWLSETAKKEGGELSAADARYLVERVGLKQQLLYNELHKLLSYNPKITKDSINLLVEATPQSTVFELLEAAFAGNHQRTLHLYQEQRALKVEPAQIIAMLAWQLHVIAILKTAGDTSIDQIASEAKMSPFVLRKSQGIARSLSLNDLKSQLEKLASIDQRSKRTEINTDEALQHYLINLQSK